MFLYSLLSEKVMVQQGERTHITLPNVRTPYTSHTPHTTHVTTYAWVCVCLQIARRMSELASTCTK